MNAANLMTTQPTTLHPEETLERAAKEMRLGAIRHLPIVDRHGVVVGVLSHRDLVEAGTDGSRPISQFMQQDVKTVGPDTPAHEAAYLLLHYKIGCVPVVDATGKLLGILTETDFLRIAYTTLGGKVSVDQLESEEEEAERV